MTVLFSKRIKRKQKQAFSLMQSVIVVLILSSLAVMALPKLHNIKHKVENQQATPVLYSLFEAQMNYYEDNDTYATDVDDLNVNVPSLESFSNLQVYDGTVSTVDCTGYGFGAQGRLASIDKTNFVDGGYYYRLTVLENGKICCELTGGGQSGMCLKMGFNK